MLNVNVEVGSAVETLGVYELKLIVLEGNPTVPDGYFQLTTGVPRVNKNPESGKAIDSPAKAEIALSEIALNELIRYSYNSAILVLMSATSVAVSSLS